MKVETVELIPHVAKRYHELSTWRKLNPSTTNCDVIASLAIRYAAGMLSFLSFGIIAIFEIVDASSLLQRESLETRQIIIPWSKEQPIWGFPVQEHDDLQALRVEIRRTFECRHHSG